jgi:glycosyltransferase involved in cell wall biosynthesis
MNILLLAPELFTGGGGIPRILRLYLKAVCERSGGADNVRFISLNDRVMDSIELKRYSTDRLVEWEVCSRKKASFIRGALQMGRRSDVIVCGHVAQLPVAWAASRINRRLRYYLVAHGIEVWRRFSFWERIALRGARGIWCVSAFTRKQLLGRCALDEDKVVVVPNALDPQLVPPSVPRPPPTAPNILSISRLSEADNYKGIDHMIDAMPAVLSQIPNARLRIVGRGDALPSLQSQAAKRKVNGNVEFPGYRSDAELREDFAACRVFSLPSEKEGFGLVYLEAFAHGRPCLGARSGGTPEVIDKESGALVEYGNVPAIATTLVEMLRRDWPVAPLLERAEKFSYLRFKERVASLIST